MSFVQFLLRLSLCSGFLVVSLASCLPACRYQLARRLKENSFGIFHNKLVHDTNAWRIFQHKTATVEAANYYAMLDRIE